MQKYTNCNILRKLISKSARSIRKEYKRQARNPKGAHGEWLLDNYYMLEKHIISVKTDIKGIVLPCEADGIPIIYKTVVRWIESENFALSNESVSKFLNSGAELENSELDFFPICIKFAVINLCGSDYAFISKAVKVLSLIDTISFKTIIKEHNKLDQIYSADEYYPLLDEKTADIYRYKTAKIALKRKISETSLANEYVSAGGHVGKNIYDEYKKLFGKTKSAYIPLLLILSALLSVALAAIMHNLFWALLFFFPFWEIIRPVLENIFVSKAKAEYAPRLNFSDGVPENAATIVAISTLLPSPKDADKLYDKLEKMFYVADKGAVQFCLLADLGSADIPVLSSDQSKINAAKSVIKRLNKFHESRFMLLVRARRFSKTGNEWTAPERKRGAICFLSKLIHEGKNPSDYSDVLCFEGDKNFIQKVKYILTLDFDTRILLESIGNLAGIAAHPMNKPVIDESTGFVTHGYGIITPKMALDLQSSLKTPFAKIMGGSGGISAYDLGANDLYSDVYGESIFCGKGLIDAHAFYTLCSDESIEWSKKHFPKEQILSHDILEGCYLRVLFASDVEMVDGFPESPLPFFKRLHRWMRGDTQNIQFVLKFKGLCRFKLFDNIRRILNPIFIFILFILSALLAGSPSKILFLLGIFSLLGGEIYSIISTVTHGGFLALARKYYSGILPKTSELLAKCIYTTCFLPKFAINSADAFVRGLFRLIFTRKKLLEWTTAAAVEKEKTSSFGIIKFFWFPQLAGLLCFFVPHSYIRLLGIFFLFSGILAVYSSKRYKSKKDKISIKTKDILIEQAAKMWRFYEDFCTKDENFLPPDNVSEAPNPKIAHRTSPTNIGLYLLSVISACDFGFISIEQTKKRVEDTISTIEKIAKWNGNLYNWYNTKTLELLEPSYVSTIDSGNFLCCLVALKESIKELGLGTELSARVENIIEATDLNPLYDKNKKLFSIGYSSSDGKLSGSFYDLLMSESRLTSYFAVAKRTVSKKHWQALGRQMSLSGVYAGPVSWSGTAFEYFMPELFLPSKPGSLSYEGAKFCLDCGEKTASSKGIPFGVSESGFYAFDEDINYQYKAHGVQCLALKRGQNAETVVSPYSTFLALPFAPNYCLKNLSKLEQYGAQGRYGFYEAVDFTRSRIFDSKFKIVRQYMAHHIGMSLLAVSNFLHEGIFQERFTRDKAMASARELLEEKVPEGAKLFRGVYGSGRKAPSPRNVRLHNENREFREFNPFEPKAKVLKGAELSGIITDSGESFLTYHGANLTHQNTDLLCGGAGIYAGVIDGENVTSLTPAPIFDNIKRKTTFGKSFVSFITETKNLILGLEIIHRKTLPIEQRQFVIKNTRNHKRTVSLFVYLEPTLSSLADFSAHQAFSKLFIKEEYDNTNCIIKCSRSPRKENENFPALAVGFLEEIDFTFNLNREDVLSRPDGVKSLFENAKSIRQDTNYLPDPCVYIKIDLDIPPKSQKDLTLLLAAGVTTDEAGENIIKARKEGFTERKRAAPSLLPSGSLSGRIADTLVPNLLWNPRKQSTAGTLSAKALWPCGISGDLPIVFLPLEDKTKIEAFCDNLEGYILAQKKLRLCGISFDIVCGFSEGGEYGSPIKSALTATARRVGAEQSVSKNGGIHFADESVYGEYISTLLKDLSVTEKTQNNESEKSFTPIKITPSKRGEPESAHENALIDGSHFDESGAFHVGSSPRLPWCHILANQTFGTLVSDKALGYTWSINSRECKITPWSNDTALDNKGERLVLESGGAFHDMINGSTAVFHPDYAMWNSDIDGIKSSTILRVPKKGMFKIIDIELTNNTVFNKFLNIAYYSEPILDVAPEKSKLIKLRKNDNMIIANGVGNIAVKANSVVTSSEKIAAVLSKENFFKGKWNDESDGSSIASCASAGGAICQIDLMPGETKNIRFVLSFGTTESAAVKLSQMALRYQPAKPTNANDIKQWLVHQTKASRLWGRTAFYQCGGAFGFRDQLQDVCALCKTDPKLVRQHILRSCASQFSDGDVLHWWHALPKYGGGKKGVRTRYSDDLLWLPYTVAEYIKKTGDSSVLDVTVPFADGPLLADREQEQYISAQTSSERATVREHCVRAINKAINIGRNRILKIGCGDWSDGLNQVGEGGEGESVWLTMFWILTVQKFKPFLHDTKRYDELCKDLAHAVEQNCWDTDHYTRAFYDDGSPLGVNSDDECQIDSLPQSFAAFCNKYGDFFDKERVKTALNSAHNRLLGENYMRLFTPSFEKTERNPGYIKSYPPGVRENGGQYTHAAVWLAMAMNGADGEIKEKGEKLLEMLLPTSYYKDKSIADKYMLEPYYIAADVYDNPMLKGRGGWSIYTGSAAWMARALDGETC